MAVFLLSLKEAFSCGSWHPNHISSRFYGARKGIRKLKNRNKEKVKKEEEEKKRIPPSLRKKLEKKQKLTLKKKIDEVLKPSVDDVWVTTWHEEKTYNIVEALEMHREVNHPSIYNKTNALVQMELDLNMTLTKQTRFLDDFRKIIKVPFPFDHQDVRVVAALAKTEESQEIARRCGADFVGGTDIIKMILKGELKAADVHAFVCHTDILLEMVPVRGLLRIKFPNKYRGSVGDDMEVMVNLFKMGVEYQAVKDEDFPAIAKLNAKVGRLNMENDHIEANMNTIIKSVCTHRSPTLGPFIKKAWLKSPPNDEIIPFVFDHLLPQTKPDEEEEEDEKEEAVSEEIKQQ